MRQPQAQSGSGSGRALATGHFPTKTLDRAGQSFVPGEWNRIDFCVPAGWLWRGAARWGMRSMLLTLDFAGSQGRGLWHRHTRPGQRQTTHDRVPGVATGA